MFMACFPRDPRAGVVDDISHLRKRLLMNLKGFQCAKISNQRLSLPVSLP